MEDIIKLKEAEYISPELLSTNEVEGILGIADQVIDWLKSVQTYALEKALNGTRFESFKLVEGTSRRAITDEAKAINLLVGKGFDKAIITKTNLLGLTDLEKIVGKKDLSDILKDVIVKPQGKLSLVARSNNKPEVIINKDEEAKNDFANSIN